MTPHFDAELSAEANSQLRQLETLLAQEGEPDANQMLRLATALRQTARLADAETVSAVAERLEDTARSIIDHNIMWSGEIRWLAQQTVSDLRLLLRALDRWGEDEEALVRRVLSRWDDEASPQHPTRGLNSWSGDSDYRERLARAQSDPPASADRLPSISSLFYDDAGPHIVEDAGSADPDDEDGEPLPMLGADAGFGDTESEPDTEDLALTALADSFALPGDDDTSDPAADAVFQDARERFSAEFDDQEIGEEGEIVPISSLLFGGQAALREARALEPQVRAAIRGEAVESGDTDGLIAELFDLLELASDSGQPTA